jgi:hypothetical protein
VEGASFCRHCGARVGQSGALARDFGSRRVIAFALSAFPGAGHMYQGHPWRAIAWFFGVAMAYGSSFQLGLMVHLICGANAASYGRIRHDRVKGRRRGRFSTSQG